MKLAINQPYFFPYLGYFELLKKVDLFIIHEDVQFKQSGWINRNRINSYQGVTYLTVPISSEDKRKNINLVKVDSRNLVWRDKLSRKFWNHYHLTPNFKQIWDIFQKVIYSQSEYISEIATSSIFSFCEYLDVDVAIRSSLSFKIPQHLRGVDRIRFLIETTGASSYLNLPGGQHLYSSSDFSDLDCDLQFVDHNPPRYRSLVGDWVPRLSILDLSAHFSDSREYFQKESE